MLQLWKLKIEKSFALCLLIVIFCDKKQSNMSDDNDDLAFAAMVDELSESDDSDFELSPSGGDQTLRAYRNGSSSSSSTTNAYTPSFSQIYGNKNTNDDNNPLSVFSKANDSIDRLAYNCDELREIENFGVGHRANVKLNQSLNLNKSNVYYNTEKYNEDDDYDSPSNRDEDVIPMGISSNVNHISASSNPHPSHTNVNITQIEKRFEAESKLKNDTSTSSSSTRDKFDRGSKQDMDKNNTHKYNDGHEVEERAYNIKINHTGDSYSSSNSHDNTADDDEDDYEYEDDYDYEDDEDDDDDDDGDDVHKSNNNLNENSANNNTEYARDESQQESKELREWLFRPCGQKQPLIECEIQRHRGGIAGVAPLYKLFLEVSHHVSKTGDGFDSKLKRIQERQERIENRDSHSKNQSNTYGKNFLMSAKKKAVKRTSYHIISLDESPDDRAHASRTLGKVRGNTVGSRYLVADCGSAPKKTRSIENLRRELGLIDFEFQQSGPSRTQVNIPFVTDEGKADIWRFENEHDCMEGVVDRGTGTRLMKLVNVTPRWDESHGGHVLNFRGRVTKSSVKNFQLVLDGSDESIGICRDQVVLQFGKTGENTFTMDVGWPLSVYQAFAICTACLDKKIADRMGYAYLKSWSGKGKGKDDEKT